MNIITTTGLDNSFMWQVGFHDYDSSTPVPQFRATIRPLTNNEQYNRVPNDTVLYEETGISLNSSDNLGKWDFNLTTNAAIAGGPYRDYQVVIEAHDGQGNTSAGNLVNTSSETSWGLYPYGYDIIAVQNLRQTGIELSNNIPTLDSGNGTLSASMTSNYKTVSHTSNGNVIIQYTSGSFSEDIVGGFIYTSTGQFPKLDAEINTGYWGNVVQKTQFTFDPSDGFINHPTANFNARGAPFIYASVSFFDALDKIILDAGRSISGLYVSNNALIFSDSSVGTISIGGTNTIGTVRITGSPSTERIITLIGSGTLISSGFVGPSNNIPDRVTTILYMSSPFSGLSYTGIGGGGVSTSTGSAGGGGGGGVGGGA